MMQVTGSTGSANLVRVLGIAILLVWACASLADGLPAWRAGQHAEAITAWRALAEQGDTDAAMYLGYVYRRGLGVAPDDALAAAWYRRAAEQGSAEAQYELALMYEVGVGVEQDVAEAARWYALSSAQACPSELSAGGLLGD